MKQRAGTYVALQFFKKDSDEFRCNHRLTLSAAEFDHLGQKIITIQDLSSRGTAKKSKRRQSTSCESDLEEGLHYEGGKAKKITTKITNKASESDKEN